MRGDKEPIIALADKAPAFGSKQQDGSPLAGRWLYEIGAIEPVDWLWKGWIPKGSLGVVYGAPGSFKSFVVLSACLSLAHSKSFMGSRQNTAASLYLALEGGTGIRRRIAAWQDYHAIEQDEEAGRRFRLVTSALPLAESVDRVIAEARFMGENGTPPDIIVIDTLSRALAGGNENDSGDMGRLVMAAERIRETTGATVLAVHHSGKDQANGARGHSLLRGAVDFEIETRKRGDLSAEIVLHKQKDGDAGLSLNVDMVSVELGHDDDGDPVTSLVPIKGDDSAPTPSKRKLPETASAGLECLRRAIAEQGQPAPASNHIPAGVSTVTKTMFRTHLELGGIINAEGNPREQMRRIIVTLKERGFIGVWGENVWTVT